MTYIIKQFEYTVLMPCLNEAQSLEFCINEAKSYIEKHGLDAEILIVDNGSTDDSVSIAQKCGARVVNVEQKGYGAALLGGIYAAGGKYIIMADSDGSYDFTSLLPFITALSNGYDLVVGNRFAGGIQKGAMPFSHRLGVPVLSWLARKKFKTSIYDFHCGLRAFNREKALALGLKSPGMEFATEIIAAFALSGCKICEVATPLRRDKRKGKPHLKTFRDGWRHLKFIFTYSKKILICKKTYCIINTTKYILRRNAK